MWLNGMQAIGERTVDRDSYIDTPATEINPTLRDHS
jgi:hypothetical protein